MVQSVVAPAAIYALPQTSIGQSAAAGDVALPKRSVGVRPQDQRFVTALANFTLFRESRLECLVAYTVPFLTKLFRRSQNPEESTAVSRMTLWERFLAHRCRRLRHMTFGIALCERFVSEDSYVQAALIALTRMIAGHGHGWQNQPLNVIVTDDCHTRRQDPRTLTGDSFAVAVADATGTFRTCFLKPCIAAELSNSALAEYVLNQLNSALPTIGPVSAVIDRTAVEPCGFEGSYADVPGAWLRLAPDKSTGGIVATADHLVLDGALFQDMLIGMSQSPTHAIFDSQMSSAGSMNFGQRPSRFATIRLECAHSMADVLLPIMATLEASGIQVQQGKDTILLTTIQQAGPDVTEAIPKRRRRILPLIANLNGVQAQDDLRQRIQLLNAEGWLSLGALVWNYIYCGNIPRWLVRYFESVSHKVPFQRTARVLSGGALVSFLPPVESDGFCASALSHLSCRTMGPTIGGPAITVIQARNNVENLTTVFITISGSGCWNDAGKLNTFRTLLAENFSQQLQNANSANRKI